MNRANVVFEQYRDNLASLKRIRKELVVEGNTSAIVDIDTEIEHILILMKIAANDRRSMILVDMLIDDFLLNRV